MICFPKIISAIKSNKPPIYFLDEAVFSSNQSVNFKVWAPPGVITPSVMRNKVSFPAIAAIAVIDVNGNIVACETRQKSYNTDSYVKFLKIFRSKTFGKVKLVVDNLGVHRSKLALEYCKLRHIEVIFNSIYSSEYMPIERVWLHAKNIWRKEVVTITNFNNKVRLRKKIVECIQSVKSSVIEKYVLECYNRM